MQQRQSSESGTSFISLPFLSFIPVFSNTSSRCQEKEDLILIYGFFFSPLALPELDELTMEIALVELESVCEEKMRQAIEAEEGLGIEYDEDVVCDVCRSPEGEDGNEMVFCDKCNVCVHQVRDPLSFYYGLQLCS